MGLGVSLLNGSEDGTLHARALKPRLTHLEALLGVGTEEGIIDAKLVPLHEEVIFGHTRVAWHVMAGVHNTGDAEAEEHVHRELNILELGVVAASGHSSIPL